MSITISADDPRTIRAVELAAEAGQWLRCGVVDGHEVFGLPSQDDPNRYYLVSRTSCECADFRRHGLSPTRLGAAGEHRPCKHVLAVRLHTELVRAQQRSQPRRGSPRRGHLRVVPSLGADAYSSVH